MIYYNFRNNSPFEYDKYTLNILQSYNLVRDFQVYELDMKNNNTLKDFHSKVNKLFEDVCIRNEKIFTESILMKGEEYEI